MGLDGFFFTFADEQGPRSITDVDRSSGLFRLSISISSSVRTTAKRSCGLTGRRPGRSSCRKRGRVAQIYVEAFPKLVHLAVVDSEDREQGTLEVDLSGVVEIRQILVAASKRASLRHFRAVDRSQDLVRVPSAPLRPVDRAEIVLAGPVRVVEPGLILVRIGAPYGRPVLPEVPRTGRAGDQRAQFPDRRLEGELARRDGREAFRQIEPHGHPREADPPDAGAAFEPGALLKHKA